MEQFLYDLAYWCGQRDYDAEKLCEPYYGFEEDNAAYRAGWEDARRDDEQNKEQG